jgi:hypothetical protein
LGIKRGEGQKTSGEQERKGYMKKLTKTEGETEAKMEEEGRKENRRGRTINHVEAASWACGSVLVSV